MEINLDAYFERIRYTGPSNADFKVLQALHYLHPLAIPFENINVFLGLPVTLQLDKIQNKLVIAQRGGYCYEQNHLFKAVLATIGFRVTTLIARVRWNIPAAIDTARSHMLLLVETGNQQYICDVGFGGLTLTAPLKLEPGLVQQTSHESFRIMQQDESLKLEVLINATWKPVYIFALDAQADADYEVANWYMSSSPESFFTNNLVIARPTFNGRISLVNNLLTERMTTGRIRKQVLKNLNELSLMIKDKFDLELPNGIDLVNLGFTKAIL